ncbi:TM0106 family RecB-like putative nuclease [Pseudonocardia bannensis]|uniref:TM0106 family RecB-like putative nuclease n=1 Tax=Pseudonocardia bannensis TaxID=630973 RepID=UPI0028ACD957|nr:TM0106 family RecB-like putative nuclease [Pseudonocardia bannensis]
MTLTVNGRSDAAGVDGILLDAAAVTRCRRRVHLDHDPASVDAPQALPDPSLEQRRTDAVAHRAQIGAALAAATGESLHAVPAEGPARRRAAATAAAVAAGAPLIWGAVLPLDRSAARRGSAELLVRAPGGGYLPVIVVRHRITDPGSGALTTPLLEPWPGRAAPDPDRKVRSQPRDLLRLAHLNRMLGTAGWGAEPGTAGSELGGVIGVDADVVVWHDLSAGHWPGGRSTLAEYDARFADRVAVAAAAATGSPALAAPSRVTECRRCPWWPTCEAELTRTQDVSLVVRGETAVVLRSAGIGTVSGLAALDPAGEPPVPLPGMPFADTVALARAWQRGLSVVRRVPRVPVPRADVEVDIDMESFGESGAYLWGALLTRPGGTRPGDEPEGYRSFATWEPVPTDDEGRSFAEFWTWLSGVRAAAAATGRTFAAYCYNEQAENRWLLASARRFAGMPGIPTVAEVESFIAAPSWVDLFALVSDWFLCAHGKGLKRIAPSAGFSWRDPEAGGENSMRWYRDAVGMDGAPPNVVQRQRLLQYNEDDVEATRALRVWMSSPAIDEVPLAADL